MLNIILFFLELLDNLRPVSPKPSHERVKTPLSVTNTVIEEEEQPFKERFLKINVRHITDGQVRFMIQFTFNIKLLAFFNDFMLLLNCCFVFTGCCWWSVTSYAKCSHV